MSGGTYNGTHWDGTQYELPDLPDFDVDGTDEDFKAVVEARTKIYRQVKPGAVVTYPDGSRYRVSRGIHEFYTCPDTGRTYRVMKLKKLDP